MTTNKQEKPATADDDDERLSPVEIRMAAVGLVVQLPMQLDDALAVLDYARVMTEPVFKARASGRLAPADGLRPASRWSAGLFVLRSFFDPIFDPTGQNWA
jgi:hypothetical protein